MNAKARIKQLEKNAPKDAAKNADIMQKCFAQRIVDGEYLTDAEIEEFISELVTDTSAENLQSIKRILEKYGAEIWESARIQFETLLNNNGIEWTVKHGNK